ncbi:hypothetical protein GCM10010306_091860 [Streptomyces umbrinus]|uniref:bifunctional 3-(3-hydroxy-phenyl)propionate/3-hydroxycinnamic acid hydroxylase n=1 Tax=Streptomyces umbrinus TaxID=67370 RepID=UPI00167837BF|nr:bifunctional 3-(3-hydroxy-phenyl)propionate/3-hydroxycinnamic acid hydroxylase [Streptomyces umbrinus]GHB82939.1 hypothetical protein GCM10010306_091860 [Streptomyces umbrinus]
MNHDFDVAIVGYGPSGLILAATLGKAGHKVVVFERWPGLYGLPRLTHIDGETARIVQGAGDAEHALRDACPVENYRYLNSDGEVLIELDWSGRSSGHPAHISMFQPDIEDAVDRHVRATGNVEVNQGWAVVNLQQDEDGVQVTARPWSKDRTGQWSHADEERMVTAKYLVGADGAGSFVRATLGVERSDNGVDDRWLNIDTERLRELPERFMKVTQFCDPGRGHMYMPIGRSRTRFELAVLKGEDQAPYEVEAFAWKWLDETHGLGPEDVKILRQVVYTFQGRIAEQWRHGRVFLIGDAAHTTPPYMGQGACSGMRDGITLGWKLDLVLSGRADDSLLDTYEAERRPHATAITDISTALGKVANTHDPVEAAARDEAFRTGNAPPPPPFPTIVAGVVHHGADGQVSPLTGTLAPQGVVRKDGAEGLFDDVVGRGFALVSSQDVRSVLDAAQLAFLADLGVTTATVAAGAHDCVEDVDGTYADFWKTKGVQAFISRPDYHLFWAGQVEELPAVVDELRARLAWAAAAPTSPGVTATADSAVAPADVLWRAMAAPRLLDCGVVPSDVTALQAHTAGGARWDDACEALADAHLARAEEADKRGHRVTAVEALRAAAADLLFAQMAFNFDNGRKRELYARFSATVARAGALAGWERVQLPFENGYLVGWIVRPSGPVRGTVIVFGGQSGWGAAYLRFADALTARGLAAFLVEGPGQGEPRLEGGLLLDGDVQGAYSAFVDHVLAQPDLAGPVGLWGNSMGGLYAGTTAASDPRVTAVCINGAPAQPRLLGMRTFDEQAAAMLGSDDAGAVERNFDRLALRPGARIEASLLVLQGGADPIVSLADQQPFLDAADPGRATLRVWDDGEHVITNHAEERNAVVVDWFCEQWS